MQIRPMQMADLEMLREIDGTIESNEYLHLDRTGEGLSVSWKLERRPLRQRVIETNALEGDSMFNVKQIVSGVEDGLAIMAEHDDLPVALLVAHRDDQNKTLKLIDIRVDYDLRRQGLATAMIYQSINEARSRALRAVTAEVLTNNLPACQLLLKCGFDLAGVDTQRQTNHDLVRESATLFWYASLD